MEYEISVDFQSLFRTSYRTFVHFGVSILEAGPRR